MPQHIIRPVEKWHDQGLLVDPTGETYDPNSPPAIIADNEALGPPVNRVRQIADRVGVVLIYGMQRVDSDLGAPGEFEKYMDQAHIFGDDTYGFPISLKSAGYQSRVREAVRQTALKKPGGLQVFNTLDFQGMSESGTSAALQELNSLAQDELTTMDLVTHIEGSEAAAEMHPNVLAGQVHVGNHLQWLMVANACSQIDRLDKRQADPTAPINLLMTGLPARSGMVRLFDALGVDVKVDFVKRETWPREEVDWALSETHILASGRLPAELFDRPIQ